MKRLILIFALSSPLMAQTGAITDFCKQGATVANTSGLTSNNTLQGVIAGCLVSVYATGTTNLATIFADGSSTPLSNPFTANTTTGQWIFYAAVNQGYDVVLSGGIPPNTYQSPLTLTDLFPASAFSTTSTPAPPAFAVQLANSLANAFQADPSITINPTTHVFTAPAYVLTGCPSGQVIRGDGLGCIAPGTAANPGGTNTQLQFNNSSAFGGATATWDGSYINTPSDLPTDHQLASANAAVTTFSAAAYGNGTTTGIAGCFAAGNNFCTAPASYAATEQPTATSFGSGTFRYSDARISQQVDFYHNPQYGIHTTFGGDVASAGHVQTCLFDKIDTVTFGDIVNTGCLSMNHTTTQPGWSIGNPATSGIGGSGQGWLWSVPQRINHIANAAGIAEGLNCTQNKFGVGDNICGYFTTYGHGGYTAASDEGTKAISSNTFEDQHTYTGTLTAGAGTGTVLIKTTAVTDAGSQGVGQYVIDTSNTPVTGTFTNIAAGLVGSAVTVDTSVSVSNAWGTLASNVGTPLNTVSPFSVSETFNVNVASGTFDTTHLACIANQFHDCAIPTAVGVPSAGVQSVTIPLRRPHQIGSYIFQGGMAGYGMEATSFTFSGSGQTLRYLFDVVGSTDANTLQAVLWQQGAAKPITIGASTYQLFNINTGLTNSGTTVSGVYSGTGTLFRPFAYNLATFTFSGSSDSALNAPCTNFVWTTTTAFTCTIAGLTGSHTSSTTAAASLALNGFKLWPMAEALDVQNETLTPPQIDGTLQLEPNIIPFSNGDTIEQTHHLSALFQASIEGLAVYNPYNGPGGASYHLITAQGTGIGGGSGSTTSVSMLKLYNTVADSFYVGSGGIASPPNLMNLSGNYLYGFLADHGPAFGAGNGGFIRVTPTSTQNNNAVYSYNVIEADHLSGAFSITDTPNSGDVTISTSGNLTLAAGGTVRAPTAAPGTNTTQIATTAFVQAALPASSPLPWSLTTTAATTDTVAVTGMTASGHCSFGATNASGATNISTTYISNKTTNQITVTHAVTASMTYDGLCTAN